MDIISNSSFYNNEKLRDMFNSFWEALKQLTIDVKSLKDTYDVLSAELEKLEEKGIEIKELSDILEKLKNNHWNTVEVQDEDEKVDNEIGLVHTNISEILLDNFSNIKWKMRKWEILSYKESFSKLWLNADYSDRHSENANKLNKNFLTHQDNSSYLKEWEDNINESKYYIENVFWMNDKSKSEFNNLLEKYKWSNVKLVYEKFQNELLKNLEKINYLEKKIDYLENSFKKHKLIDGYKLVESGMNLSNFEDVVVEVANDLIKSGEIKQYTSVKLIINCINALKINGNIKVYDVFSKKVLNFLEKYSKNNEILDEKALFTIVKHHNDDDIYLYKKIFNSGKIDIDYLFEKKTEQSGHVIRHLLYSLSEINKLDKKDSKEKKLIFISRMFRAFMFTISNGANKATDDTESYLIRAVITHKRVLFSDDCSIHNFKYLKKIFLDEANFIKADDIIEYLSNNGIKKIFKYLYYIINDDNKEFLKKALDSFSLDSHHLADTYFLKQYITMKNILFKNLILKMYSVNTFLVHKILEGFEDEKLKSKNKEIDEKIKILKDTLNII